MVKRRDAIGALAVKYLDWLEHERKWKKNAIARAIPGLDKMAQTLVRKGGLAPPRVEQALADILYAGSIDDLRTAADAREAPPKIEPPRPVVAKDPYSTRPPVIQAARSAGYGEDVIQAILREEHHADPGEAYWRSRPAHYQQMIESLRRERESKPDSDPPSSGSRSSDRSMPDATPERAVRKTTRRAS